VKLLSNRGSFAVAAMVCIATIALAQQPQPGPFGRGQGIGGRGGQGPGGRMGGPPRDSAPAVEGAARITGRVLAAETGAPIRRAQVRAISRDARTTRQAVTDINGRYEILSLPAGRYQLHVSKAGFVALEYGQARPFESGKPLDIAEGQLLERIDFSLPRGSAISGRVTDEFGDAVTDAQIQVMRYQFTGGVRRLVIAGRTTMTDDLGQFRVFGLMPGDYIVRASLRMDPSPRSAGTPDAENAMGYPGTYYPGVIDVTQAQTVTVALGSEVSSVAFSLVPSRLSQVSGTVMSSAGRPLAGAFAVLRPTVAGPAINIAGGNQTVRPDGGFRFSGIPSGEYVLDIQQRPGNMRNAETGSIGQLESASMPVTVAGDVDGIVIVTAPGSNVSGRVVFQGQQTQKPGARGMMVTANSPTGDASPVAFVGRQLGGGGNVRPDGSFELHGLSGPQLIRLAGAPAGWAVKSISLDGSDITDAPFDFKPGVTITNLVITLTDRVTNITGDVRDARGQPVADYVLVVFAEDARLWGAQSRHVAVARPNQNSAFTLQGLPPGRYLAAAVPALENGTQNDTGVLNQLRSRGTGFSLAEGQTVTLNLEMAAQ
jgi:hypothetical protein